MPDEQMNVTVTPALARYVRGKIKAGCYGDASVLVRDALRALRREEETSAAFAAVQLTAEEEAVVRLAVRRGRADIRHGRYKVLDAAGLKKLGRQLVSRANQKGMKGSKALCGRPADFPR